MLTQDQLKQLAAQAALAHIEPLFTKDAVIGVGTGSTADLFIDGLAAYKHLFKATVASSERSALRLQQHGIPVLDLNEVESLVVYVDGADEINESLAMIKGGGGALTREKIVASVAKKFVCIADESKLVEVLGAFPLPLEVIPMAQTAVMRTMEGLGGRAVLREGFITDNGNIIVDVHNLQLTDPLAFELMASQLPGVVTCGIFAKQCAQVALLATQSGIRQLGQ